MDIQLIKRLNQLNNDFYNTTSDEFNDSRQYFWKGWDKISPLLDEKKSIRVADIGCGNGRFGQFLINRHPDLKLSYTGIDSSQSFLEFAQKSLSGKTPSLHLNKVDIVESLINDIDLLPNETFFFIASFGVFHHIPSYQLRLKLLKLLLSKTEKEGYLTISLWKFFEFDRFKKKILKPKKFKTSLNFSSNHLESNDYILDWQRGPSALRYCHYYSEEEINQLISDSKANLVSTFRSDGKEENVNQYLVLQQK